MKLKNKFFVKKALVVFLSATMFIAPFNTIMMLKPQAAVNGDSKYYDSPNYQESQLVTGTQGLSFPADSGNALTNSKGVTALTAEQNPENVPNAVSIEANATYTIEVAVPQAGGYIITTDYYVPQQMTKNVFFGLKVNDAIQFKESKKIYLDSTWKDSGDVYEVDKNGNERPVDPVRVFKWEKAAINSELYNLNTPYVFNFNKGINTITIENGDVPFYLSKISLGGKDEYPSYSEYKATTTGKKVGTDNIIIESEKYSTKSESFIMPVATKDIDFYPQDDKYEKVNLLDEDGWAKGGQGITYNFNIQNEGLYYIVIKNITAGTKNKVVFKNLLIDGKPLYDEMYNYTFPYNSDVQNEIINVNDENVQFYLTAGEHSLTLETTAQPEFEAYEKLLAIVENLNKLSLDIQYITGGKSDKNRDWELETFMPDLVKDLEYNAQLLQEVYDELYIVYDGYEAQIANLLIAKDILIDATTDLNYLANHLDILATGSNSCVSYATLVITGMITQFLVLDRIYITGDLDNIPDAQVGFGTSISSSIKQFAYSFTDTATTAGDVSEELDIWVNKSAVHIEMIKKKFEEFNEETGKATNISAMGDEQKLLLSVAADAAPDLVIGASNYRPFDFALRGAIYDLRQFDDFETILDDFVPETLVPFIINDSCYGIPDSVDFKVTFFRKDIFEFLGLEVPKTWNEVIEILPELSRYGKSVASPLAGGVGLKGFDTTVPFIQQYGGQVYQPDGTAVAFGDPKTVAAFTLMTDLYTKYSLPASVPQFYNSFRRGTIPLGISNLNTFYLLRDNTPELTGLWGIAPSIGVEGENGEINIQQPSVGSCSMILANADKPDDAWEAIKWWMSEETQTEYANELLLRFGPEYFYNSANINALKNNTSLSPEDLEVFLYQFEHTQEIPRNPAYFNVERELSDAWNRVVFDGEAPRNSLDKAIINSNREIEKKLKEFDYMDQDGNMLKPFTMASGETVKGWMEEGN